MHPVRGALARRVDSAPFTAVLLPKLSSMSASKDRILSRDKTRDVVRCGAGRDVAIVDRGDSVSGCESVSVR